MAMKSVPPLLALLFRIRLRPRPFSIPPNTEISRISPVMGMTGSSSTSTETTSRLRQEKTVNFLPTSR